MKVKQVNINRLADFLASDHSPKGKVVSYLIREMDNQNRICKSQEEIAKKVGVHPGTVNMVMRTLIEKDYLKKLKNSVYMISPELFKVEEKYGLLAARFR